MRSKQKKISPLPILLILAAVLFVVILILDAPEPEPVVEAPVESTAPAAPIDPCNLPGTVLEKMAAMPQAYGIPEDSWPEELLELLEKNPDTEHFVLNYPLLKDTVKEINLAAMAESDDVPTLYQWDTRWGYTQYGDKMMGISGCGPTCLSMVCIYFLKDAKYTPRYVADFAEQNGYYTPGFGSNWALMSEGATQLGLNVVTIPPNAYRIMANLEVGNLVLLSMGPGDFTTDGHFLLLTGAEGDLAVMHDPNSKTNTQKLWDVDAFRDQIQNVWVFLPIEE